METDILILNGTTVPEDLIDIDANGNNILDENEERITLKATPFSLKNNKAMTSGFRWILDIQSLKVK